MGVTVVLVSAVFAQVSLAQSPTQTPSPTETPSPTPSPSSTLVPTSTIAVRFVSAGHPVTITLAQPIGSIMADGDTRGVGTTPASVESSGYSISWPLQDGSQPVSCTKGPPTVVRFDFLPVSCARLSIEILWTGPDVTGDVEVPASCLAATPTPVQLPETGWPSQPHRLPVLVVLVPAGFLVAAAFGFFVFRASIHVKR